MIRELIAYSDEDHARLSATEARAVEALKAYA